MAGLVALVVRGLRLQDLDLFRRGRSSPWWSCFAMIEVDERYSIQTICQVS